MALGFILFTIAILNVIIHAYCMVVSSISCAGLIICQLNCLVVY